MCVRERERERERTFTILSSCFPQEEDETDQGAQGDDEVDAGEEVKTEVKPPLVSKLDKRLQVC